MKTTDGSGPRLPDRRQFLSLGVGALVVAAVPFARARRRLGAGEIVYREEPRGLPAALRPTAPPMEAVS